MNEYKNIHIGKEIKAIVNLKDISIENICSQLNLSHVQVQQVYKTHQLEVGDLLKWCKLLNFDLFRLYSTHLQIYFPSSSGVNVNPKENEAATSSKYQFRKRLYTPEMISFILNQINNGKMTTSQIIKAYSIPKTTIYRWMKKDENKKSSQKKKVAPKPILIESYEILLRDILYSRADKFKNAEVESILGKISAIRNFNDVENINKTIFFSEHENIGNYQRVKSFDKDKIDSILRDRLDNNLNNCEIARKYKISRNTIAKWIKLFA